MDRNKENIYNGNPTGELSLAGLEAFVKSKDATTESSETSPKGPSLEGLNDFVETAKAQRPYNMLYSSLTDVGKAIVKGTTPSSDVDPYLQHKMAAPATFTIDVPSKPQPL